MAMATTGSNHGERHLARPPRSARALLWRLRMLRFPFWVSAVLSAAALCFVVMPAASGSAQTASTAPPTSVPTVEVVVPILFPLEHRIQWTDTFGAPRSGGRTHAGHDLMVPKMTPVLAVVDGTLDWMNLTGRPSSFNNFPFYNILLRGDDGNDYFYIHLNNDTPGTDDGLGGVEFAYAPGLTNGSRVSAGDVIGYVGDSGNAEDTLPHLHFEIHLGGYVAPSGTQTRPPSAINPWASLRAAPTLAEWIAAGKPPLGALVTGPGAATTTVQSPAPTTTTTKAVPTTPATTPGTTLPTTPTTPTTRPDTSVPGFRDVRTTDWFYQYFARAAAAGVVLPEPNGTFGPYVPVTRALFAAYLVRAAAPAEIGAAAPTGGSLGAPVVQVFDDVSAQHWAFEEIQAAARLGLVFGTGDGSNFSPERLVTRAQMATMICRALGPDPNVGWAGATAAAHLIFNDVPRGYWAQGAIVMANYLGLLRGDATGRFRPEENANRAHAVILMARVMQLHERGPGS